MSLPPVSPQIANRAAAMLDSARGGPDHARLRKFVETARSERPSVVDVYDALTEIDRLRAEIALLTPVDIEYCTVHDQAHIHGGSYGECSHKYIDCRVVPLVYRKGDTQ